MIEKASKPRFNAEEAHEKNREFEKELSELQERIGYTFQNQQLLAQAFTSPGFTGLFNGGCASNKKLEEDGDWILRQEIDRWIATREESDTSNTALRNTLNSNSYFSSVGMRLEMNRCVRVRTEYSRTGSDESKIRLISDAFEALVYAIELDGGQDATHAFINRFVLPDPATDPLFQSVIELHSRDFELVRKALHDLTGGDSRFSVQHQSGGPHSYACTIAVFEYHLRPRFGESASEAVSKAVSALFRACPWLFWGAKGPVSPKMSSASRYRYGEPLLDQYKEMLDKVVDEPVSHERIKSLEEDAWPAVTLPDMLEVSTAERGPYIDRLRIKLEDKELEVRSIKKPRDEHPRFAFYIDSTHHMTVEGRKNLNDAAHVVVRGLDEK